MVTRQPFSKTGGGKWILPTIWYNMNRMRIRVVSDLHIGSSTGLLRTDSGKKRYRERTGRRRANEVQERLWEYWVDLWKSGADILVVNGDIMDLAEGGDLDEVTGLALEVLEYAAPKVEKVYLIAGTPFHEKHYAGLVEGLGVDRVYDHLMLNEGGLKLSFAHHPELGGSAIYPGTVLSRTAFFAYIASARKKVILPDVIVRGHFHYYGLYQEKNITVVQAPAFCYQDYYAVRKSLYRFIPDVGAVDLVVEKGRVSVQPILYE